MKTLDVQAKLEYARAAVAVLRALQISDRTMRYNEFARAIGMMSENEKWEAWHRHQITDILYLVAAAEAQRRDPNAIPLAFDRIVTGEGEPGAGFWKKARIEIT